CFRVTHHNHKSHKTVSRDEAELTVVDSPEPISGKAQDEAGQAAIATGLAAELPLPTEAESAEQTLGTVSRTEFDRLKAERDQLLDRLARLQAEFENARKRTERERT